MTRVFENPANKYREKVGSGSAAAVFFFGVFFLLYKGLWSHALAWIALVGVFPAITEPALVVFTLPLVSIFYALAAQKILAARYLKNGWIEIPQGDAIQPPTAETSLPAQPETRACPFCAEDIKAAAIKCKHCQSELPALA